jgi:hypothetical protein
MKQKDVALIILIIGISAFVSFFVSGALIKPSDDIAKVQTVDKIDSTFNPPSEKYYNEGAINPTQLIRIGDEDPNADPF